MNLTAPTETSAAADAWRPRYHFTPRQNWMNDPNGLVFHEGEYHLYYQYNPLGSQWGHISWGHAISEDLVSWRELPVAIPATDRVMAFSGSVVVDHANTGGFAPPGSAEPALVAFFTGFDPVTKIQSQHLAYSLDRGRTYTPYAGNPVIDIQSTEFRDPKVFWHTGTKRWVMLVVAALQQEVWFYTSADLKDWQRSATFGPAGSAANNIWEVPELVELPVRTIEGHVVDSRWVLFVSVNHGTLWGGSGVQYFVGHFDGTRFTAEESGTVPLLAAPAGELIEDFEEGRLPPGWQLEGEAFGHGPVAGTLPGQPFASGYLGRRLMNSGHGGDGSTGAMTSPVFTITRPFLGFQIAGGASPLTRLELWVGDRVVYQAHGIGDAVLRWRSWDVRPWLGQQAVLRAVDEDTGDGGYLLLDHLVLTDGPVEPTPLADLTLWADHGRDFYAPLTFANVPDGRVLWLGWMSNWDYARQLPTAPWRGQMSGVRELDLVATPAGLRLRQQPVVAWQNLAQQPAWVAVSSVPASQAAAALAAAAPQSRQLVARLEVLVEGLHSPIGLQVLKVGDDTVSVGFDPVRQTFFVDRRTATPLFPGQSERHEARRWLDLPAISLEFWVDGSTIELFADGGTVVISDVAYPRQAATAMALFHGAENPSVTRLAVHGVRATLDETAT